MQKTWVAVAALLLLLPPFAARAASFGCGAAKDLMVQALERVSADSRTSEVVDANELLKRAAQMCPSLGDAWYYRSVMEKHLGSVRAADFAHSRAELIGSEALDEQIDPFQLATAAAAKAPVAQGTRWALVIGIGKFADAELNTLRYAAADARLFADAMRDPGVGAFPADHVRMLLDAEATTKNIKASLNWIARQAKPEDLVVVYVATHGSARDLDSVGGINYLITADTEGGSREDQDALFATALPLVDLVNTVATRIHSLRTAIFLDACYSGSAHAGEGGAGGRSLDERTLRQFGQGSGRIILSAAKEDQESNESAKLAHGFFTFYLVEALRSSKGATPLTDVYADVRRQVMAGVAEELKAFHTHQEPVMSRSSETTDFALGGTASAALGQTR